MSDPLAHNFFFTTYIFATAKVGGFSTTLRPHDLTSFLTIYEMKMAWISSLPVSMPA